VRVPHRVRVGLVDNTTADNDGWRAPVQS